MFLMYLNLDGCETEEYQGVTWPETSLGSTAAGDCPCSSIIVESAGKGNRFCGGTYSQGAVWSSDVDLNGCFTSKSAVSQQLCNIALLLVSSQLANVIASHQLSTLVTGNEIVFRVTEYFS